MGLECAGKYRIVHILHLVIVIFQRALAGIGAVIRVIGIVPLAVMDHQILEPQEPGLAPVLLVQVKGQRQEAFRFVHSRLLSARTGKSQHIDLPAGIPVRDRDDIELKLSSDQWRRYELIILDPDYLSIGLFLCQEQPEPGDRSTKMVC